eukprot:COSAG01_NODE_24834_length_764_cov_4.658647_2_plen_179_part_00
MFRNDGNEELWGDTLALFVDDVFQDLTSPIVQRHVDIVRLQDTEAGQAVFGAWLAKEHSLLLPRMALYDEEMTTYTDKYGSTHNRSKRKRELGSTPASQEDPPTKPKIDEGRKTAAKNKIPRCNSTLFDRGCCSWLGRASRRGWPRRRWLAWQVSGGSSSWLRISLKQQQATKPVKNG